MRLRTPVRQQAVLLRHRHERQVRGSVGRFRVLVVALASAIVFQAVGHTLPAAVADSETEPETQPGSQAAATLPEVIMVCRDDQTDINHAEAQELMAALEIDRAVAGRVIEWRPYLAPSDLAVVEGIGPSDLAAILARGNTCATPTQLPPPSDEACLTADRVDLAAAPPEEMAERLNLNVTITTRIAEARPFSVLAHVSPERVPGVGKGILKRVVAASCLTPAPVRTAAVTYRWAYRSQTTTVERDGYELTIGAGVLDQTGAWARITPIDHTETADDGTLPTGDYPSADFHIEGAWANGDTVKVTLPHDPLLDDLEGEDGWSPFLLHHRSDGSFEGFRGDSLTSLPDGRVSAQLDSLSEVDSLAQNMFSWTTGALLEGLFGHGSPTPSCHPNWPRQYGTSTHTSPVNGATLDLTSAVLELPGNPPSPLYPLRYCVESDSASTDAITNLRNNTAGIVEVQRYGWTDTRIGTRDDNPPVYVDPWGWVMRRVLSNMQPDREYLSPGGTAWFATPRAAARAVDGQPLIFPSAAQFFLDDGIGTMAKMAIGPDTKLASATVGIAVSLVRCLINEYDSFSSRGEEANAVASITSRFLACTNPSELVAALRADLSAQFRAGNLSGDEFKLGSLELRKVDRWLMWLKITGVVVEIGNVALWDRYVPNGIVSAEHRPPRPTVDSGGRRIVEQCLGEKLYDWVIDERCQDGYYTSISTPPFGSGGGETGLNAARIVRNKLGHNWLVDYDDLTDGHPTARHIADEPTYLCLVRHYVIDWDARLGDYTHEGNPKRAVFDPSRDATCDWSVAPTRPLSPGNPAWRSAVLRQPDGTAWIAHSDGGRQHISSAEWFTDLVTPEGDWPERFVWDQVTDEELSRFPEIVVGEF